MKWTKELENNLKTLINNNKKHEEIAQIMGLSIKSISNKCFRLGLKIKHKKEYKCKNCGLNFECYVSNDRIFCSNRCSTLFNNKGRIHSEETKSKIRTYNLGKRLSEETKSKISENNGRYWLGKKRFMSEETKKLISEKAKQRTGLINIDKPCKNCGESGTVKLHGTICENCKLNYYKYYRPSCEFNFNIMDYEEKFNLDLLKEFGWYSPTNKGNNLMGVSKDHLYSVSDGFKNGIDPNIIKHPANCQLVLHNENNVKNSDSHITLEELLKRICEWDKKYVK